LTRWLANPSARRLLVVSGQPGVGKTALAVRLAHRVAEHFPDGQLFVDLHGFSSTPAIAPADVLLRFLRALGHPAELIPEDLDERTALLRSVLAERRVLLVLDNAATADQVRPLLPGTTECAVIVTSRNVLSGLVAVDGARGVRVGALTTDESTSLLSTLLEGRGDVRDEDLRRLADACGGIPLALRIAAAHLVTRNEVTVSDLLEDLSRYRLDVLTVPHDGHACVRTAIDVSYAALSEPVARLLLSLSLLPTPEFSVPVAAAVGTAISPRICGSRRRGRMPIWTRRGARVDTGSTTWCGSTSPTGPDRSCRRRSGSPRPGGWRTSTCTPSSARDGSSGGNRCRSSYRPGRTRYGRSRSTTSSRRWPGTRPSERTSSP